MQVEAGEAHRGALRGLKPDILPALGMGRVSAWGRGGADAASRGHACPGALECHACGRGPGGLIASAPGVTRQGAAMKRKPHFSRKGHDDYLPMHVRNLAMCAVLFLLLFGGFHVAQWLGLA